MGHCTQLGRGAFFERGWSLPQRPTADLRVLGNSVWGPGGEPMGLALSTVKDFGGDLYSGEHPRSSSVTDRIGLLFCKDPGGCRGEEDGWDEGPQEQRGGQLGAPSAKLQAQCWLPQQPCRPQADHSHFLCTQRGQIWASGDPGHTTAAPVSHCLLAFPLLSLSLLAALPTHQTTRWFSLLHLSGHSSHTQAVSNKWLSSHLSWFWSGVFLTSRYKDPQERILHWARV